MKVKPGISDHDAVVINADIKPKIVKLPKRKVFLYKKVEFRKIADDLDLLNNELTDEIICQSNVDELWNHFNDTVHKSMDANIPSKMTSSKPSVLWINPTIKRSIRKKTQTL